MTGLQGVLLVAGRELKERARSKAYIFSTIFTILLLGAIITLPSLLAGGPSDHEIGVVGDGGEEILATASAFARDSASENEDADTYTAVGFDSAEAATAAVVDGEIEAAIVNGSELISAGGGTFGDGVDGALQRAAATRRVEALVSTDTGAADVVALLSSEPLETRLASGESTEEQGIRSAVAFGGLVLMYIAILTYGMWMLSGITEEKTNRVVEILLATLKPWQIFAGKLVGIGLLGLGQLVMVLIAASIALRFTDAFEIPSLPADSVVALIGWFIVGFLLYATLFGAAGSLVSRMEDAQTAAAPLSVLAVVGYLFSFMALNDPSGLLAKIGTFVPFTAPYVAPIRLALQQIAPWEMVLSAVIALATIAVMVRLGGRVYRGGILQTGGRVKWLEAFRSADWGTN